MSNPLTLPETFRFAAGYVRCSTEMQEDSPEQQRKEIEKFAEKQGYRIIEWFVDFGKSGTTFEQRPEFLRLRTSVEQKPLFQYVICYDESRWGRAIDTDESTYWKFMFRRLGVEIVLVKTSVDPTNDFAPMLTAMEAVQASQYSKKLSELTKRGQLANGKYSSGGTAPYGYKRAAVNRATGERRELRTFWDERTEKWISEWCATRTEKVIWELGADEEVSTVKKIFEMRLSGCAYTTIAQNLNAHHVSCARRGRWRNMDAKWATNTVKAILDNPAYYGARVYNKMSDSKIIARKKGLEMFRVARYKHWRNPLSEWIVTENAHPALIPKAVWEKVQAMKESRSVGLRNAGQGLRSEFLLTGLMRCNQCGYTFQGWATKSKGHVYPKYVCSGWHNKKVCKPCYIKQEEIERVVLAQIKIVLSDTRVLSAICDALTRLAGTEPVEAASRAAELAVRIEEMTRRIENLVKALEGGAEMESVVGRLRALEKERQVLMEEQSQVKRERTGEIRGGEIATEVSRFMETFEVKLKEAVIEERKRLVRSVVAGVWVDQETRTVMLYLRRLPAVNLEMLRLYESMERQVGCRNSLKKREKVVGKESGPCRT